MTSRRKKADPNQVWCRKNVSDEEHARFWENWSQTQWGLPTFGDMRRFVEAVRASQAQAAA